MSAISALLEEYRVALLREPEQRRAWLDGLTTQEGADLFAELHNMNRTTPGEQEFYQYVKC